MSDYIAYATIIFSMIGVFAYFAFELDEKNEMIKVSCFILTFSMLIAASFLGSIIATDAGRTGIAQFFELFIYVHGFITLLVFYYIIKKAVLRRRKEKELNKYDKTT